MKFVNSGNLNDLTQVQLTNATMINTKTQTRSIFKTSLISMLEHKTCTKNTLYLKFLLPTGITMGSMNPQKFSQEAVNMSLFVGVVNPTKIPRYKW